MTKRRALTERLTAFALVGSSFALLAGCEGAPFPEGSPEDEAPPVVTSQPGAAAPADQVEKVSSALLGATWDYCDPNSFAVDGMVTPWLESNRLGVNLANQPCSDFKREFEVYDYKINPKPNRSYFVLYNRRTGLLRSFLYILDGRASSGQKFSTRLRVTQGGTDAFSSNAFFSYASGAKGLPLSDRASNTATDLSYVTGTHTSGVWLILDSYLSYDSNVYPSQQAFFRYDVSAQNDSAITLTGTIKPDLGEQTTGSYGGLSGAVKAGAGAAFSAFGKAMPMDQLWEAIKNEGKKAKEKGAITVGDLLISAATSAAGAGANAFITAGASTVISALIRGPSSAQVTYPTELLNATGAITNITGAEQFAIPVSTATLTETPFYSRTYTENDERALGLFNVKDRVSAKLHLVRRIVKTTSPYQRYDVFFDAFLALGDMTCQVVVNQASTSKLKEVKVSPGVKWSSSFSKVGTTGFAPPSAYTNAYYLGTAKLGTVQFYGDWNEFTTAVTAMTNDFYVSNFTVPSLKAYFKFDTGPGREAFEMLKAYDTSFQLVKILPPATEFGTSAVDSSRVPRDNYTCAPADGVVGPLGLASVTYSGNANWYSKRDPNKGFVAVSGILRDNETSSVSRYFTGSSISFSWKTDSEYYYDWLNVYVDEQFVDRISGPDAGWLQKTIPVPYGRHTVRWEYSKDYSYSYYRDRAYVGSVVVR